MNVDGADERHHAANDADRSLQLLRLLRNKLAADGSDNLPVDALEIVDDLIAIQGQRSARNHKISAVMQYDICLEVCGFLDRAELDQARGTCRFFYDLIEGNEATTPSLRPIVSVDVSLNFGIAPFFGGNKFVVASSIRCHANESRVTNVVEYSADDLTSVLTTVAPFLRTSFCNSVSIKFSHNELPSDLDYDVGLVKEAFASRSKGVSVRDLTLWMKAATPERVTETICLFESVKRLSISWSRSSPAYFDQEFFSRSWQKGIELLDFGAYPRQDLSPTNAMQSSDIIAFCCAKPHTGGHRVVTALYADTSNLFEDIRQHVGGLPVDAELAFTLEQVRLPDVERLEQHLRESYDLQRSPYIINDLENHVMRLDIATHEQPPFGSSTHIMVRIAKDS